MSTTPELIHSSAEAPADRQTRNERIARRGRALLWFLVVSVTFSGIVSRYLLPQDLYLQIVALVGGEIAQQEAVLAQNPVIDVSHRLLGLSLLITGMLQFDPRLRRSRPMLHRWTGRVFLSLALLIGATGLFMGLAYPFSGVQEAVFVSMACALLLWFASMAWREVRQRRFALHREWMIRTLGLCFFVTVQRLYYMPMVVLTDWPDRESFAMAGWLSLLTVLIAAECWINLTRKVSTTRSPA